MLGWVLCTAHLIFCPPIIACGGQQSPLHGHGCSLCVPEGGLIRGKAVRIPPSRKIVIRGAEGGRAATGRVTSDNRQSLDQMTSRLRGLEFVMSVLWAFRASGITAIKHTKKKR